MTHLPSHLTDETWRIEAVCELLELQMLCIAPDFTRQDLCDRTRALADHLTATQPTDEQLERIHQQLSALRPFLNGVTTTDERPGTQEDSARNRD